MMQTIDDREKAVFEAMPGGSVRCKSAILIIRFGISPGMPFTSLLVLLHCDCTPQSLMKQKSKLSSRQQES